MFNSFEKLLTLLTTFLILSCYFSSVLLLKMMDFDRKLFFCENCFEWFLKSMLFWKAGGWKWEDFRGFFEI